MNAAGSALRLHIGTYTRNGGSGLYPLSLAADRRWKRGSAYPGAQNASFGAYSARHGLHYLVDEDDGALGIFRRDAGRWQCLGRVPTYGDQPCYAALNADEDRLAVANYGSGNIVLYQLDERRGLPSRKPILRRNVGSGPVADRQDGAHAHCVCFDPDGQWLYHVDLGTDQVIAYAVNGGSTAMEGQIAFVAPPGSGPRHLVFHPALALALLVSELASTLTLLEVDRGQLVARQTVSTLPEGFAGESLGGHLSLNAAGDRAYVTNRGHDSIAVFAWEAGGALDLLQHTPSGGASPRAFAVLDTERHLMLANEKTGNVATFDIEPDGTLRAGEMLDVPGAAFLFVE